MRRLSTIVARMQAKGLVMEFCPGNTDLYDRAGFDSREIDPNDCFVAIKGHAADGHLFIDKAVKNGAVAIVYEAAPAISREDLAGVACVRVSDSRHALLEMASYQAGDPAGDLTLVGTTGTNGKTTVATLIRHVMEEADRPCGFIGTTGHFIGDRTYPAGETTPSPVRVYDLLSEMSRTGCKACSMEVSSHALDQWRVDAADFDAAVFTNLTRDHLDYHQTEQAYLKAKKRLFEGLGADSTAVINIDDPAGRSMMNGIDATIITFGSAENADVRYEIFKDDLDGLGIRLDGVETTSHLAGRFNAGNIAAAYACGLGLNISAHDLRRALEKAPPVSGRFELIRGHDEKTVVVDYAHTPDALENLLRSARLIVPGGARLWCVFGCGGDRDKGKRAMMAGIAEDLADRVIVTSDNPRTESPESIIDDITMGFSRPEYAMAVVDRREAIQTAAAESQPGDLIVIAGKGHETYQTIGETTHPFDDRVVARSVFRALENRLEFN